jgi:trans-aconitate methyltransferase
MYVTIAVQIVTLIYHRDVADEFPAARVTGLDLSPIQPTFVPPGCTFEIDDVTLPWTYDSEQFDLIYVREMFGSLPDWEAFLQQCWASLRPGGYIEVVEHSVTPTWDNDTSLGPIYASLEQTIAQVEQVSGRSFSIWRESAQLLEGSGFQDITKRSYKWPISACVTS